MKIILFENDYAIQQADLSILWSGCWEDLPIKTTITQSQVEKDGEIDLDINPFDLAIALHKDLIEKDIQVRCISIKNNTITITTK